ncbi:LytR/AlgR family response regulator, partial [Listeria ivanovii FSL F6-596]
MRFRVKQDNRAVVGEVDIYCHPNDVDKVTNIVSNLKEKISVKKDAETYLLEPNVILY